MKAFEPVQDSHAMQEVQGRNYVRRQSLDFLLRYQWNVGPLALALLSPGLVQLVDQLQGNGN